MHSMTVDIDMTVDPMAPKTIGRLEQF